MKNKKKEILFLGYGNKEWIGGLYYIKNYIHTYFEKNNDEYTINIITNKENVSIFNELLKNKNVNLIVSSDNKFNKVIRKISSLLFKKTLDFEVLSICKKFNIDYIYPIIGYPYAFIKPKCIFWIPDFQHAKLPEMFEDKEIKRRNSLYNYYANSTNKLILSSNDAYKDFKELYPFHKCLVYIMPFKSKIDLSKIDLSKENVDKVINKYNLPNDYYFLPNQFWKHKNHITVFKAFNDLINEKSLNVTLICTGNESDYRNKEHCSMLKEYIIEHGLDKNIKMLGFISREDQLVLMKAAKYIIQPSLFEGWGTVVEDAKVFNKNMILSDINVHFEQKNSKCNIFPRYDFKALSTMIKNIETENLKEDTVELNFQDINTYSKIDEVFK